MRPAAATRRWLPACWSLPTASAARGDASSSLSPRALVDAGVDWLCQIYAMPAQAFELRLGVRATSSAPPRSRTRAIPCAARDFAAREPPSSLLGRSKCWMDALSSCRRRPSPRPLARRPRRRAQRVHVRRGLAGSLRRAAAALKASSRQAWAADRSGIMTTAHHWRRLSSLDPGRHSFQTGRGSALVVCFRSSPPRAILRWAASRRAALVRPLASGMRSRLLRVRRGVHIPRGWEPRSSFRSRPRAAVSTCAGHGSAYRERRKRARGARRRREPITSPSRPGIAALCRIEREPSGDAAGYDHQRKGWRRSCAASCGSSTRPGGRCSTEGSSYITAPPGASGSRRRPPGAIALRLGTVVARVLGALAAPHSIASSDKAPAPSHRERVRVSDTAAMRASGAFGARAARSRSHGDCRCGVYIASVRSALDLVGKHPLKLERYRED